MLLDLFVLSDRAAALGKYPISSAVLFILSFVALPTSFWSCSALLTVAANTPHAFAISLIDTIDYISDLICLLSRKLNLIVFVFSIYLCCHVIAIPFCYFVYFLYVFEYFLYIFTLIWYVLDLFKIFYEIVLVFCVLSCYLSIFFICIYMSQLRLLFFVYLL